MGILTMGKGGRRGRLRYNEFTGHAGGVMPPQFLGFLPWRSSRLGCARKSLADLAI
jgi:hypothetical protein